MTNAFAFLVRTFAVGNGCPKQFSPEYMRHLNLEVVKWVAYFRHPSHLSSWEHFDIQSAGKMI